MKYAILAVLGLAVSVSWVGAMYWLAAQFTDHLMGAVVATFGIFAPILFFAVVYLEKGSK